MKIIIQKYGGTSLNTFDLRNQIIKNIKVAIKNDYHPVLVVSAMGRKGEPYATDTLISLIKSNNFQPSVRNLDFLMSCGEMISSAVLANQINQDNLKAIPMTGGQAGIITDNNFGNSKVLRVDINKINELLIKGTIPIVSGFQGMTDNGEFTTLGRGGSDVTASILGCALDAHHIEIFTDVDGIMTADPKIVSDAKVINNIDYNEVFQLAEYGAKVIHPRAIEIAMQKNIPIQVMNTLKYADESSVKTSIFQFIKKENKLLSAIAHMNNKVQIQLYPQNEIDSKLFNEIAKNDISIDLINIFPDRKVFIIDYDDKIKLENILSNYKVRYEERDNCTKVTIVGHRIRGVPGVMARILNVLSNNSIPVLQTSDSHTTISILVDSNNTNDAINILHNEFELNN